MKQRYHSNATTNIHLRSEINKSTKSNTELSVQYSVSEKTIVKWKTRNKFTDKSSRPNTITYSLNLPKINGVKYYLFVAIDRATRTLYYQIYDAKSAANAEDFLEKCIEFFPVYITHILTDNGLEFTNRLLKSKKGGKL